MIVAMILAIQPNPTSVNPFAGPHADSTYTYSVSGPARLTVTTVNGGVTIKTGEPGKITVLVNRRAQTQAALSSLGSRVEQNKNTVALTGTFPEHCGTTCGSVDFIITVPAQTDVVANTDSGDIAINDTDGSVTASTKAGAVRCGGLAGNVTLGSLDGMLNAGFRDLTHVSSVVLGTQNGVVRVVLPANGKVKTLKAATADGKIFAPWKVATIAKGSGAEADLQLNSSGPAIVLGTGHGDVDIVTAP